jgi:hypothetical protein
MLEFCQKLLNNTIMKKLLKFLLLLVAFAYAGNIYSQGNTTSSINGVVYDAQNQTLPGATILAVHEPSGSRYTTTTGFDGHFRISNMRVGGPYKIEISFVGLKKYIETDAFLQLGDSKSIKVVLVDETNQLKEVVVVGSKDKTFNSRRTGAQTVIDNDKINELPSLSRNIADFARLTPQAQLRGDDVISIGGQNNRFNAIYIDGAVNNDVFGLASNGTNGGQTGVSPISLDAIDQFQVSVSPYDVKLSGFAGGAISAITRSGTNNFDGSAYFLYRDQSLAGKTPQYDSSTNERKKLSDFTAQTYGVRAGGAIINDKLFYFVNYEKQDNETPQPFDVNSYVGTSKQANFDALSNYLLNTYNYNPGTFNNNTTTLESDKFIAKIDWNINDNHKLSVKNSYVKANNFSPYRSTNTAINFLNGSQSFESVTNSSTLELNSRFSNKFSNNLVVGYTTVNDDRDPFGDPFPTVTIRDGSGTIYFGSETNSTANLLNQKTLTITDNFEINTGKHNILIGTHNEFSYSKNVFISRNFGAYEYNSLNDFITNAKPFRYRLGYSLFGGSGDDSQGAAEFNMNQYGLYLQDNIRLSDNFRLSVGVRADMPVWEDGAVNTDFNTRTVGLLETAGKDLKGARVGQAIKNTVHFSPRAGFNYDVNGDKVMQIRGGVGVFTSRVPLVWPGGAYNNNGMSQNAILINNATATPTPNFNANTAVDSQLYYNGVALGPLPGSGKVGGNVDLFAKDFKLPQVLKTSLGIDRKLGSGFVLSFEAIYNDNLNAIQYENLNIKGPQSYLTGADNRPMYKGVLVDKTYQGIYLASNKKAGSAWNTNVTLAKNFRSDFIDADISATYAYGESKVWMDATSSQNSSQWNYMETVNGSNAVSGVSISDFDQGSRVIANSSVKFKWNKSIKTTIGLFYEGVQGTPFSYVYNDSGRILQDSFQNSALIYVPASRSEINLVTVSSNPLTPDQQWAALINYIDNDKYLSSRKGKYAERNADRLEWSNVVDLKLAQEFALNVNKKSHKLELTVDVFNFTNMLNNHWGRRYFASNDQVLLLNQVGFLSNGTTPTFNFNPNVLNSINQIDDVGLQSARWQMQVGVRYSFN